MKPLLICMLALGFLSACSSSALGPLAQTRSKALTGFIETAQAATTITVTVVIPSSASATKSISLSVNGATAVVRNIGSGDPGCSGSGTVTCTFSMSAPIGADIFVAKTFSGSSGSGSQLASANFDDTVSSSGKLNLLLGGSVSTLGVALSPISELQCSGSKTISVRVTARSSTGAVIVGAYSSSVTLSDSDTTGATHLSNTTLASSSTVVTLMYNGFVIHSATISASATGASAGKATLTAIPLLYTTDFSAINVYASTASGNAAPLRRITGSNTKLFGFPANVTHDRQCNIYAVESTSIIVFANGANGNAVPSAVISGSLTTLNGASQAVVASSGKIYVANTGTASVLEFAAGTNGNVAPSTTVSTTSSCGGDGSGLGGNVGLALDASGNIYNDSENHNCVYVFAANASGVSVPIRTIGGTNTYMDKTFGPYDLAIGPTNELYVADYYSNSQWLVFTAGANGNVAPLQAINQSHGIQGVAVDYNGLIYIPVNGNAVDVYAANATGNATPVRTISGANTLLQNVQHLSI